MHVENFGCVVNGFVCQCICLGAIENQHFSRLTKNQKHKFQKKNGVMPSNSYFGNKWFFNTGDTQTPNSKPAAGRAKLCKKECFSDKNQILFYAACVFVLVLYILCLLLMYVCVGVCSIWFVSVLDIFFYNFVISWLPCRSRICNFQCNCMCVFHCIFGAWCVWFDMHVFILFCCDCSIFSPCVCNQFVNGFPLMWCWCVLILLWFLFIADVCVWVYVYWFYIGVAYVVL